MDRSTFEAIHRYGAILSVVAIAIAVLSYALGGPDSVGGLLGLLGPLCGFYFVGGYLYTTRYHVVGEEFMRGVAWYFGSLIGWSVVVSQTSVLSATPATVVGLPAVTALAITLVMIATRYLTGRDLKVYSEGGQLLVTIAGAIVFGLLALSLVLAGEAGWWLFGLYLLGIPGGLFLRRVMKRQYPQAFGTN